MKMSYQAMVIFIYPQKNTLESCLNSCRRGALLNLQISHMIYRPFKWLIAKEENAGLDSKRGEDMSIGKLNTIDSSQLDLDDLN